MEFTELSKLAWDRGCKLNVALVGGVPIYWVENSHFIGRPFRKLDELTRFLRQIPDLVPEKELENLRSVL
jgi:hypothetical protein